MEKIIMKSFLYTIAILVGVTAIAEANSEPKQKPSEDDAIILEEVKASEDQPKVTKEETK